MKYYEKPNLNDRAARLFACDCAERALGHVEKPDPRSVEAVRVARLFADGNATTEELAAARNAAWNATWNADWNAAGDDAWAAQAAAQAAAWEDAVQTSSQVSAQVDAERESGRQKGCWTPMSV